MSLPGAITGQDAPVTIACYNLRESIVCLTRPPFRRAAMLTVESIELGTKGGG